MTFAQNIAIALLILSAATIFGALGVIVVDEPTIFRQPGTGTILLLHFVVGAVALMLAGGLSLVRDGRC